MWLSEVLRYAEHGSVPTLPNMMLHFISLSYADISESSLFPTISSVVLLT